MAISVGPNLPVMVSGASGDVYLNYGNALLRMLQALIQSVVKSVTTTTPPSSPANGDRYIIPSGATGAWSGNANALAYWSTDNPLNPSGEWEFYTPIQGWAAYNQADGNVYIYNGTTWATTTAGGSSPGGTNNNIQYNNSGAFAGSGNLSWNNSGQLLSVGGSISVSGNGSIPAITFTGGPNPVHIYVGTAVNPNSSQTGDFADLYLAESLSNAYGALYVKTTGHNTNTGWQQLRPEGYLSTSISLLAGASPSWSLNSVQNFTYNSYSFTGNPGQATATSITTSSGNGTAATISNISNTFSVGEVITITGSSNGITTGSYTLSSGTNATTLVFPFTPVISSNPDTTIVATLTPQQVSITFDSAARGPFVVNNGTTDNTAILIKSGSGSSVNVLCGTTATLYSDGAGNVLLAADISGQTIYVTQSYGSLSSGGTAVASVSLPTLFQDGNFVATVSAQMAESPTNAGVLIAGWTKNIGVGMNVCLANYDQISHNVTIHIIARHN